MGTVGFPEMIAIFVVALILFGPKKLPELGRTLGKALSEFRRAKNELKNTFETHMRELERETRIEDSNSSKNYEYSPAQYSYPYEEYNRYDPTPLASPSSPHELNGGNGTAAITDVTGQSEPAVEHSELPEQAGVESAPVADTVPRVNGTGPADAAAVAEHQEHPV